MHCSLCCGGGSGDWAQYCNLHCVMVAFIKKYGYAQQDRYTSLEMQITHAQNIKGNTSPPETTSSTTQQIIIPTAHHAHSKYRSINKHNFVTVPLFCKVPVVLILCIPLVLILCSYLSSLDSPPSPTVIFSTPCRMVQHLFC